MNHEFYNTILLRTIRVGDTLRDFSELGLAYRSGALYALNRQPGFLDTGVCLICHIKYCSGKYSSSHCLMECQHEPIKSLRDGMRDNIHKILSNYVDTLENLSLGGVALSVSDTTRWPYLVAAGGYLLIKRKQDFRAIPSHKFFKWLNRAIGKAAENGSLSGVELRAIEESIKSVYSHILGTVMSYGINMLKMYMEIYLRRREEIHEEND